MKSSSPKQQAIIVAIITALVAALSDLTFFLFDVTNYFIMAIFVGLLVFIAVYLLILYSLNSFIYNKLKPIYKTIQSVNYSEKKFRKHREDMDRDLVEDVQHDVLIWAKRKTREIAQLREVEKYRREFLGNVSHELKTPIFNIQGYVSTLLDGGLEDETINYQYLERTDKSVNRLISIVDDLESISRLESGILKLDYQNFDIIKLIGEVFEAHEMMAKERGIKLILNRPSDKALLVHADKQRILDVLNNLVINSVKYGRDNGQTLIDFHDMEENVLIEIKDNGMGIAEEDLPRIFERFYRTDKSRSREMGGTGLGLAIVKHILEAHKQNINVSSQPNKGSSFTFTLTKAV